VPRRAVAISGRLARAYFTLLRHGRPMGVREVQRLAGLSGPSSAKHYLDRLVELGLAERRGGEYVARVSRDSLMSVYVGLLGSVVPRLIPYAAFSTTLIAAYYVLARPPLDCLVMAAVPTALLWAEGLRLARLARRCAREAASPARPDGRGHEVSGSSKALNPDSSEYALPEHLREKMS